MKATEQYFAVVFLIMLYKVVLTAESVNNPKAVEKATWKNSGLNEIRTHNLAIPMQCFIHWATKPHG